MKYLLWAVVIPLQITEMGVKCFNNIWNSLEEMCLKQSFFVPKIWGLFLLFWIVFMDGNIQFLFSSSHSPSQGWMWFSWQIKPAGHSHKLPPPGKKGRTYICSCLLFMRPTYGGKLILKEWINELEAQPWSPKAKANDQPAFNWALNKTANQVPLFSIVL